MENKSDIPSGMRPHQGGSALIVAMILLAVISLAGVTAMQGAVLQERMAGGQKQLQDAFLDGEQQLLAAVDCVLSDDTGDPVQDCGEAVTSDEDQPSLYNVKAVGEAAPAGASQRVAIQVDLSGGPGYQANGAFECLGSDCSFDPTPSNRASADGSDRVAPEQLEDGCDMQGQPPALAYNEDGSLADPVAGLIIPDGDHSGDVGDYDGSPPLVDNAGDYEDRYNQTPSAASADANAEIDRMAGFSTGLPESLYSPSEYEEGAWVVGEGETFDLGNKTAGGILILDGGTLEFTGNACFSGLVMIRNGGSIQGRRGQGAGGTAGILGAVLSVDNEAPSVSGNVSFNYSSQALDRYARSQMGGKGVANWRTPYE